MRNVQDIETVELQISSDKIWDIWSKGEIFAGNDPVLWRRDACGAWIFRSHYGRKDSEYGWAIECIEPLEGDAAYDISNLRPVQWENKGRGADPAECRVTSSGVHNDKPTKNIPIEPLNPYPTNF